jgi:hypothetical protein
MSISIKVPKSANINVKTQIAVPESLSGIDNVDIEGVVDGSLLVYDGNLQRYTFKTADTLLSSSVQGGTPLPANFINTLDSELDNRVSFDGGEF